MTSWEAGATAQTGPASLIPRPRPAPDPLRGAAVGTDPPSLTVYEAKGGSSPLGERTVDGVRVEQGTAPYLNDVVRRDPRVLDSIREYLTRPDADPAVVQAIRDGSIEVHYDLVRARPDGTVVTERFVLDPSDVDVARWIADSLDS